MYHRIESDMDAISLVLEALVAGGANGKNQETYSHLKDRLMESFSKQSSPDARLCAEVALKEYEKDHEVWKEPLRKALTEVGVEKDAEIIQTAQKILHERASDQMHMTVDNSKAQIGKQLKIQHIEYTEYVEMDTKKRPLGTLKGKASYKIKGDFKITDDEFLSS